MEGDFVAQEGESRGAKGGKFAFRAWAIHFQVANKNSKAANKNSKPWNFYLLPWSLSEEVGRFGKLRCFYALICSKSGYICLIWTEKCIIMHAVAGIDSAERRTKNSTRFSVLTLQMGFGRRCGFLLRADVSHLICSTSRGSKRMDDLRLPWGRGFQNLALYTPSRTVLRVAPHISCRA